MLFFFQTFNIQRTKSEFDFELEIGLCATVCLTLASMGPSLFHSSALIGIVFSDNMLVFNNFTRFVCQLKKK